MSQCSELKIRNTEQIDKWIREKMRCWRCGRAHRAAQCDLKKSCNLRGKHLHILHEVNQSKLASEEPSGIFYLNRPSGSSRVLLKMVKVVLHHRNQAVETYALLDDGSECTVLLAAATQHPGLIGTTESLVFYGQFARTQRHLMGPLSPSYSPQAHSLAGPAAIHTRLGWVQQGLVSILQQQDIGQQCLLTSMSSQAEELYQNVEKLWQIDVLPYCNEKTVTRSKQDQEALELLEAETIRVPIDGVSHYATPLLRTKTSPQLRLQQMHLQRIER
ncbi:hypothetical protein SKAU_G00232700 [Synaphobranchus kaupii]|uniref:Uncharacterized protein n=1 Tax=Synaphobranchus kaupii TaxID=118154 RepID=A0A9Q1F6D5_SYNKA|nr:hypothetical protein SKAU_G00232700 [Synaphobranchus kaupii]